MQQVASTKEDFVRASYTDAFRDRRVHSHRIQTKDHKCWTDREMEYLKNKQLAIVTVMLKGNKTLENTSLNLGI